MERARLPIITVYDPPPIPTRHADWRAWREGTEDKGPYGYGLTKQDAIDDLVIQESQED